jgi:hypothetical protein
MNVEDIEIKKLSKEERKEYGQALEAGLKEYAGVETVNVLRKRDDARRADAIEKAIAPLYAGFEENRQNIKKLHDEIARAESEHQERAAANVTDDESYEAYLKERQLLILAKSTLERQDKQDSE